MPQDNEAATRAFYDHEIDEQPRTGGRRRRPAADWGVGEDIFDRMPSPRFGRRGEHHEADEPVARTPRQRGAAAVRAARARSRDLGRRGRVGVGRREPAREEPARDDRDRDRRGTTSSSRKLATDGAPDDRHQRPSRPAAGTARPAPARTAVDRIGARPDRIVGYTVALGFLLILIAILTT